ncbi:methyltransferase domain-containing protein [Thermopolyspora sp. NPDC052614]|uniref:class I SAM-dependent methyltransferase n=1 Tax=Thermopolyspora sp. NPDC052614 TaxID=3155682 RepID=UPI00341E4B78
MILGKLLHNHAKHHEAGGTIDRPRVYDVVAQVGFLGRRREIFTRLAALSGVRPGHQVLDVGCGTGYLTRILSQVAGHAGHVTGVDHSAPMIEYARGKAPDNCSYLPGEGQELDLPDERFDVVVSSLALHHIPADRRGDAVREMFRVLRPGGRLLIADYRPPANPLLARLAGLVTGPAMRHDPRESLRELVAQAGFRLQDQGDLPMALCYVRAARPAG